VQEAIKFVAIDLQQGNRRQGLHSPMAGLAVAGYWFEFAGLQDLTPMLLPNSLIVCLEVTPET